ncbi:MAG: lipid-A-disaccharide synthase N-terminal domain-containing protein [Bdellovibrionales bacterium]
MIDSLINWISTHSDWWTLFGLVGQILFMSRMLVQWVASEKARRSVVPEAFWYLSLIGGAIVLTYGIQRNDLVIILGQMFGVIVYVRNIYFIWREKLAKNVIIG